MSYPYPKKWLDNCISHYEVDNENLSKKEWFIELIDYVEDIIKYHKSEIIRGQKIASMEGGPLHYMEALNDDLYFLEKLEAEKDFDKKTNLLSTFKATALSRKKYECDEILKEKIKDIRKVYKEDMGKLFEKYFAYNKEIIISDMEKCKSHVVILTQITKAFMDEYSRLKKDKNVIDFNDMEHLALEILVYEDENGSILPSQIAMNMADEIYEIMIDEYQDSNLVQETILNAVSTSYKGKNNVFMVGDVKQSIYKFRLARPSLFMEKYDKYPVTDEYDNRRITLSKNFRSRREILDATNFIFSQIMTRENGGIEYDLDNALYYGADYKEFENVDHFAELLVLDKTKNDNIDESDVEGNELEAFLVAQKIESMINEGYQVTDKLTNEKRNVRYSDFAILLRSISSFGEIFNQVFAAKGIPLISQVKSGYFESFEASAVIDFLRIIDNERQDIPLMSVLKNIFRISEEEIALEVSKNINNIEKPDFYDYIKDSENEKFIHFIILLNKYRKIRAHTSIYDLIVMILEDTGFEYFIQAMKGGKFRKSNLQVLKERAILFEKGSYSGLFNFIRYIENLKKFDLKQEEAVITDGNAVNMLTIHKSKGLEFPVVILAGMGKKFNNRDAMDTIVIHQDMGIGLDYYDRKTSIKAKTLIKESISKKITNENLDEELRVLYVALTRAKEKLIMTGSYNMESFFKKNLILKEYESIKFSPEIVYKSSSYMEWVLKTLLRHRVFSPIYKEMGETVPFSNSLFEDVSEFKIEILNPENILYDEIKTEYSKEKELEVFNNWNAEHIYNEEIRQDLQSEFSYIYPHEKSLSLKAKVSVSDLKQQHMKEFIKEESINEDDSIKGFKTKDKKVPYFMEEVSENAAIIKGLSYHRVFEIFDFSIENLDDYNIFLKSFNKLYEDKRIKKEELDLIDKDRIYAFIKTDLGQRFIKASKENNLFREKQFVMGLNADILNKDYPNDEYILIQGIVDAFFIEDDAVVIVDYKTDRIKDIKELEDRYKTQLDLYKEALSKITNKKVKECILYSVHLNMERKI